MNKLQSLVLHNKNNNKEKHRQRLRKRRHLRKLDAEAIDKEDRRQQPQEEPKVRFELYEVYPREKKPPPLRPPTVNIAGTSYEINIVGTPYEFDPDVRFEYYKAAGVYAKSSCFENILGTDLLGFSSSPKYYYADTTYEEVAAMDWEFCKMWLDDYEAKGHCHDYSYRISRFVQWLKAPAQEKESIYDPKSPLSSREHLYERVHTMRRFRQWSQTSRKVASQREERYYNANNGMKNG
ncbi:MAG: hypothetical protein SGARI_005876, partial [Bacillariaceae sp.]